MQGTPEFVSPHHLEALLNELASLPGSDLEGFFGPQSITWRINREAALFLGAGRAALLQLAHPWVAASLVHHSNLMNDAIGRFHSTFRVIYTMLFGSRQQALSAARQLHRRHTGITGELPASLGAYAAHEHYEANEVAALRWVFATLVESAVLAHDFVFPPLPPADCDVFYAESKRMAALCGIPPGSLPATWADLLAYTSATMASSQLAVDEPARRMGQAVLSGVGTWVRAPRWYRALTASWLPGHLRAGFGLPFGSRERRSLDRAAFLFPRLYLRLPGALRFVGPYGEATARLWHRPPGVLTQGSNRFWMGVPRLLYPQHRNPRSQA